MPKDDPRHRLARQAAEARSREVAARLEAEGLEQVLRKLTEELRASAVALAEREGIPVPEGLRETPLQPIGTKGTVGTNDMEAPITSPGGNISAAKTLTRAPFPRALHKRGLSIPEWARAQRNPTIKTETARSWTKKPGKGGRPCPRFWADRIEAEFIDESGKTEVPATRRSWPSGVREDG